MHSQYQIRTLAELLEAAQAIHNEAIADNEGSIDPSEILIDCDGWDNLTLVARSHTLTDKSVVYDVHIPVKQPEHGPAVIATLHSGTPEEHSRESVAPGYSNFPPGGVRWCSACQGHYRVATVTDVCIAGNPAQNGICGDPDCVCAPKPERRTIDITPRGLTTQEGIIRCNKATEEFTSLTATVANLATEMVETHARNEQWDSESHDELKAAIASRRAAQEEFLRSLCGAPPAA